MKESLKPIEPGCLCIVINCKQTGIIVSALEKIYYSQDFVMNDKNLPCWRVDKALAWSARASRTDIRMPYCPEKNLMRIDPDEDDKKMFQKEDRDLQIKKRIKVPVISK